ncbi:DUF5615 family PIN-like protein [Brunnivagina elsteri]|uniref:DUF5615 family PIN-like protein n=1 Tax=Brunnivagina elsteri TaxID=1247191 RepID=UPI0011787FF7|nr:DUF5615 family PIN-like protein [Calothrix elsteri]
MIKFYTNENVPFDLVEELRKFGYDVLTSYDAGQANQSISDENVLKFAYEQERIIVTLNREDFISLHQQGYKHSGILICKDDRDYKGQAEKIREFIVNNTQLIAGRLIRIKKQNQKGYSAQVFIVQEY